MKVVVRVLYSIMVVIVGSMFIYMASIQRIQKFYFDSIKNNLQENYNLDEFVEDTMLVSRVGGYTEMPLYSLSLTEGDYKFDLNVFHFYSKSVDVKNYGMMFYITNFKANEEVSGVTFEFISSTNEKSAITYVTMVVNDEYVGGNVLNPIVFVYDDIIGFSFTDYNNDEVVLNNITTIKLSTFVINDDKMVVNENPFAVINHDDNYVLGQTNEMSYVNDESYVEINDFSGEINDYKFLNDNYNNEDDYKTPDVSKITGYNQVIRRVVIIYIIVIIIVTYLIFFLKPTIKKIKESKNHKDNVDELLIEDDNVE